jgi:phage gpG-like protein
MTIAFSATIDDAAVMAKFTGLPTAARNTIVQTTKRLGLDLQRHVQADKLSGHALGVRTNTLRSSINLKVEQDGDRATAAVGTNVRYAGAHEYGIHEIVSVREHLRAIKEALFVGNGKAPHWGNAVLVRAHSMRMMLPERSFLRSALHDMARISAEYQRDLAAALR